MIEYIVEYFTQDRTSTLEWISLIVDSVLALSFLASCFFLLFKHVKFKVAGPICLVYAGLLAASYFLDLLFIEWILYIILALLILMGVVIYCLLFFSIFRNNPCFAKYTLIKLNLYKHFSRRYIIDGKFRLISRYRKTY